MSDPLPVGSLAIENFLRGSLTAAQSEELRNLLGSNAVNIRIEEMFDCLRVPMSDTGTYTANGGTANSSIDGDFLALQSATANHRPNVIRFRGFNRVPSQSGAANVVVPMWLCTGGQLAMSANGNGANLRCGVGMVTGATAVAADAPPTTGRGFGWELGYNPVTAKVEFCLWAHNGTGSVVKSTPRDSGFLPSNLDGYFQVIVRLRADGQIEAYTVFGNGNSPVMRAASTPTDTLAGGPTSGAFANNGIPMWIAASHSTNAPTAVNSIMARIQSRALILS